MEPNTHTLAEEAAHWLIELEEPGPEVLKAFTAWLETSPRHVEEFLCATAVWKELDNVDAARRVQVQLLVDEARNNVRALTTEIATGTAGTSGGGGETSTGKCAPQGPAMRRGWITFAGALAASLLVAVAVWLFAFASPNVYATSLGEQRTIKLRDGSVVYLNTKSRVEVHFSKQARDIRLLEGEALFTVEHDAARPFRVTAGPTVIQAIGTRFNVYRSTAGTTVSVVEGVVQMAAERVAAGEQARVSPQGKIVERAAADLAQVVAWRERRLVFRGDSLDNVASQFNRYNTLQIRVEGDAARHKQLTGVFDADDPRSLLLFLRRDAALAIENGAQEVVIHPSVDPPNPAE